MQIMHIKTIMQAFQKVQKHRYVRFYSEKQLYIAWKCWDIAETNANDQ